MMLTGLLSAFLAGPALAQGGAQDRAQDDAQDAPATEAVFPVPELDVVVRVPLGDDSTGWVPPTWALPSDSSLALEKKGTQLIAMVEEVQSRFQPAFAEAEADATGRALTEAFLANTYAGPRMGEITWAPFQLVESGNLGRHLRGVGQVVLSDRPDEQGQVVIDLFPVRAGLDATIVVGVATAEEALAAADEMAAMIAFYDGPVAEADLPFGHHVEDAGYELDLPAGLRALTERERLALNGEPVGGNSGFGGALAFQTYLDPTSMDGARSFGCVAFSADTLEVVAPEKAPRLADNYRLMAATMLKGGSYKVDGGKPIRGRSADVLGAGTVRIDPEVEGTLSIVGLGDRDGYLWRTEGVRTTSGQEDQPVAVATFYTAWSDVNLHCQASVPAGQSEQADLLTLFEQAVVTVRVSDGAAHPMHMSLMARYKRWWPYTNPLLQLFWLPIPIVLFAAWLANRGD